MGEVDMSKEYKNRSKVTTTIEEFFQHFHFFEVLQSYESSVSIFPTFDSNLLADLFDKPPT